MPQSHTPRIKVADERKIPIFHDGTTSYDIIDATDGKVICRHRFQLPVHKGPLDTPDWYAAHLQVAQAIADALNAAPNAAIEYIRQKQREAHHVWEMAERQEKQASK